MENVYSLKYGKQEAKIIAGIAIIMMLVHHLFGFQEYLHDGSEWIPLFSFHGIAFERLLASFGKMCVSIFAFQSGYALWISRGSNSIFKRGLRFLINYWLVMAFFLLCGWACHSRLPNASEFLSNLVGLETGPQMPFVNISFAWYVTFYLLFITLSLPLTRLFKMTDSICVDFVIWICLSLTVFYIQKYMSFVAPLPLAITGIIAAKHNVFDWLNRMIPSRIGGVKSYMS